MPIIVRLVAVFFFLPFLISAQRVTYDYTKVYEFEGEDQVEAVVILSDGLLVGVGKHINEQSESNGLLLVINPDDGQLVTRKVFDAGPSRGGFMDIAEAGDGSLYLVGYVYEDKKNRNAWLLRLDQAYEPINEHIVDLADDNLFHSIVWLEKGHGLVAGWKDAKRKGKIWVKDIDGGDFQGIDKEIGNGAYGDIIGMDNGLNNQVWLSGNTQKSKESKKGDAWVLQIDSKGAIIKEKIIGENYFDQLHSSSASVTGELLLGGEKWTRSSDFGNSWVLELGPDGNKVYENVFEAQGTQIAAGVLKKPRNDRWVSLQSNDWAPTQDRIKFLLAADDIESEYPIEVGEEAQFEIKKIL